MKNSCFGIKEDWCCTDFVHTPQASEDHHVPTRPERAEAPSPGHRPGLLWAQTCRPVRAKAFNTRQLIKLLPLQGALLIAMIPRALPWARSFCPFRACGAKLAKIQ